MQTKNALLTLVSTLMLFSSCDGGGDDDGSEGLEGIDTSHFLEEALVAPITQVDCTLSDGTETTCYRIEIIGVPTDHDVGPFCPRTIDDGPEDTGIWFDSGTMLDADGALVMGLAELYDDANWQLYDEDTGIVRVTETQEACEAAARPDVDPQYQNHCVECSLDYVDGGVEKELLIPVTPIRQATPTEIGGQTGVGVALSGAHMDPPAPVDAILSAYTIAPFDDCGGHINPATGYHYHAATGCPRQIEQSDGHAALIGYALDGFAIHAMADSDGEPADLDACRGHSDSVRGYHYHAASAGENMFIGCFSGLTVGDAGGTGPGDDVALCEDVGADQPCCGDDVCDGPETAENCAEDCV